MLTRQTGGSRTLPGSWERRGACKDVGPDVMHPGADTGQQQRARDVCARCPVRTECLLHAIDINEDVGTWGGLGEAPRKRIRKWMLANPDGSLMDAVMAVGADWVPSGVANDVRDEAVDDLRRMASSLL